MGDWKPTPAQREFFSLVTRAAACNPFSDEFAALQARIAGAGGAAERWQRELAALQAAGVTNYRQASGEDRELLRYVCLYEIYHRYLPAFDGLIAAQLAAGDKSVPVGFYGKARALFERRGFSAEEARRYFAIFYQIRRAYHFIETGLVGASASMRELRRHLWNHVFTHDIRWYEQHLWNRMEEFSTMLLGPTGSGKGTAAAAIGRSGFIPFDEKAGRFEESFTRTFRAINLSQFPETLIESELFGHKKGAFTGAIADHEGVLARGRPHGAIFLDEIGDLSIPVQIKLLQVLQERTFTPVGSHEPVPFRGRVIAATNQPLDQLRAAGRFRDDFYYRLCSDIITVPTLRQRIAEDATELDALVRHVAGRLGVPALADAIRARLDRSYPWPGNVRELEQAIRRILLTNRYDGDRGAVAPDATSRWLAGVSAGRLDADELLAGYCRLLHERHGTIEAVARQTNLDRRTVKAYLAKRVGPA